MAPLRRPARSHPETERAPFDGVFIAQVAKQRPRSVYRPLQDARPFGSPRVTLSFTVLGAMPDMDRETRQRPRLALNYSIGYGHLPGVIRDKGVPDGLDAVEPDSAEVV